MDMKQAGFTLIELVMVIVILGILAAVAVPKFIDLKSEADVAAVKGVAGGVASAFAINYAAFSANSTKAGVVRISASDQGVSAAANSVVQGGLPTGYTYTASASTVNCGTGGATMAVSVSSSSGNVATATLVCTG